MDDRRRQILATLAQMDKQFGKGSVLMLGSRASLPVEVITTGSIAIDSALGAGGFLCVDQSTARDRDHLLDGRHALPAAAIRLSL